MTLAQVPSNSYFRITKISAVEESDLNYIRQGLRTGNWARLLCRHPGNRPVVFELLLDNSVCLSVPALLAHRIEVSSAVSDGRLT